MSDFDGGRGRSGGKSGDKGDKGGDKAGRRTFFRRRRVCNAQIFQTRRVQAMRKGSDIRDEAQHVLARFFDSLLAFGHRVRNDSRQRIETHVQQGQPLIDVVVKLSRQA